MGEPPAAIAGAVIGSSALFILVLLILWWYITRRTRVTSARRGTAVDLAAPIPSTQLNISPSYTCSSTRRKRDRLTALISILHFQSSKPSQPLPVNRAISIHNEDLERSDTICNLPSQHQIHLPPTSPPRRSHLLPTNRSASTRRHSLSNRSHSTGLSGFSDPRPRGHRHPYLVPAPPPQAYSIDTFTATTAPLTATTEGFTLPALSETSGDYTEPWLGTDETSSESRDAHNIRLPGSRALVVHNATPGEDDIEDNHEAAANPATSESHQPLPPT